MKKIIYKTPGAMLAMGENGEAVSKFIVGTAEMAYSEENLEYVKTVALNGEYTVEDDGQSEPDTTSTDDVLNALLGVTE